jgi:hypothetical protein
MSRAWISEKAERTHPLCDPASSKVFAMLMAYMDDSGTHNGAHNCVVGGYWGYVSEWRRFEKGWKAALTAEGVEEFHAKEFWQRIPGEGRVGQYASWSDERHAKFINRLLRVIETTNIIPFSCGVLGNEWAKVPMHRKAIMSHEKEKLQKPVLLPLTRIFYRIASYCKQGEVMNFTFDEDRQNFELGLAMSSRLALIKRGLKEDNDSFYESLGSFEFADSKKAYPLQAADLLAYESHRFAKAVERNLPMRSEYRRALTRAKAIEDFWLFDEKRMANLEKIFAEVDAKKGESDAK